MLLVALVIASYALLIWRSSRVLHHLYSILDQLHELAKADLEAGREWEWRYKIFSSVKFESMVWRFWRPLNKFGLEAALEDKVDYIH